MATKRALKKDVNNIVSELFAECLISKQLPGTDQAKADELMEEILKTQTEFVCRLSHPEPGNTKNFYKTFYTDFNARVETLLDSLGKLK